MMGRRGYESKSAFSSRLVSAMFAGAAGTSAMDALLYRRYRRGGGTEQPLEWEFSAGVKSWADASAPGLVGRDVVKRLRGKDVPQEWARSLQNTVHWATGVGWALPLALIVPRGKRVAWVFGVSIGVLAWISSYVVLPFTKIYKPIWDYDAKTLEQDLTAHLLYGVTLGTLFAVAANGAPDRGPELTPGSLFRPALPTGDPR
jgi:hypothetical protein